MFGTLKQARDYLTALYHFGAYNHSGQWSKLYSMMCLAKQYHERWFGESLTLDVPMTADQWKLYRHWEKHAQCL